MTVYGISDLHLSFGTNKPMNVFGKVWEDYEKKIVSNWEEQVKDEDIVIIPGDISWGLTLKEALPDFNYIEKLPGKKIILRGNHDYYFPTRTKLQSFLKENNINSIEVLHNNAIDTLNYIICGTRGWGKTEILDAEGDKRVILREKNRLKLSLEAGKKIREMYKEKGIDKKIVVAMHFPPFLPEFKEVLESYDVQKCIYGHLHGYGHTLVKEGVIDNIEYIMVSCDYTNFKLKKI